MTNSLEHDTITNGITVYTLAAFEGHSTTDTIRVMHVYKSMFPYVS